MGGSVSDADAVDLLFVPCSVVQLLHCSRVSCTKTVMLPHPSLPCPPSLNRDACSPTQTHIVTAWGPTTTRSQSTAPTRPPPETTNVMASCVLTETRVGGTPQYTVCISLDNIGSFWITQCACIQFMLCTSLRMYCFLVLIQCACNSYLTKCYAYLNLFWSPSYLFAAGAPNYFPNSFSGPADNLQHACSRFPAVSQPHPLRDWCPLVGLPIGGGSLAC